MLRLPAKLFFALSIVCLFGCSTIGQLELSSGQVSVYAGEKIKADPRKREVLLDDAGVNRLHDHVVNHLKRNKIRKSI